MKNHGYFAILVILSQHYVPKSNAHFDHGVGAVYYHNYVPDYGWSRKYQGQQQQQQLSNGLQSQQQQISTYQLKADPPYGSHTGEYYPIQYDLANFQPNQYVSSSSQQQDQFIGTYPQEYIYPQNLGEQQQFQHSLVDTNNYAGDANQYQQQDDKVQMQNQYATVEYFPSPLYTNDAQGLTNQYGQVPPPVVELKQTNSKTDDVHFQGTNTNQYDHSDERQDQNFHQTYGHSDGRQDQNFHGTYDHYNRQPEIRVQPQPHQSVHYNPIQYNGAQYPIPSAQHDPLPPQTHHDNPTQYNEIHYPMPSAQPYPVQPQKEYYNPTQYNGAQYPIPSAQHDSVPPQTQPHNPTQYNGAHYPMPSAQHVPVAPQTHHDTPTQYNGVHYTMQSYPLPTETPKPLLVQRTFHDLRIITPSTAVDTDIRMDNTHCPPGYYGIMADPTDCSKFINCRPANTKQEVITGNWDDFCQLNAPGVYPHPYECSKFIKCSNCQLFEFECAIKTDFNGTFLACDHKYRIRCHRKTTKWLEKQSSDTPSALSEVEALLYKQKYKIQCHPDVLGVFPHPFNNSLYIKCVDGYLLIKSCRPGQLFSLSRNLCDIKNYRQSFDTAVPIHLSRGQRKVDHREDENNGEEIKSMNVTFLECPANLRGKYVYPFLNTRYINCAHGITEIETCLNGAIYSIRNRKCLPCNKIDSNDCIKGIDKGHLRIISNNENLGVICGPKSVGLYVHPSDWRKFVICTYGVITVKICPADHIFDKTLKICVKTT